ncbi:helix-turn-helix domain-containing protein [Streptomyces hygroscopicus]|uniref:helix-turn-helix domain-containing protein n=1 Tax=Streptomyces hygroscopicus TaxID=1912 RepID=UPI0007854366|nr:helix-turn-helix transcriptional regulator [Streptomyces hygroscopicus]MBW8093664.1 helix-turn-helix domain-containing protein [Streptomyces hygroscopicus subsp. hygroscopicus]
MPPRDTPTARQVRLGTELRRMRERAGRTARETAGLLGVDQARVSNIEAGRIGVSGERIRRLATFYACADTALVDALCAIAEERRGQFWWDEYRGILAPGFLDVAEMEHHAVYLRSMQAMVIPGLLQTEDYARVLFQGVVPPLPSGEIDARVEHRMRRQAILERDEPVRLTATIHEAALRMRFGGRKVARAQLERLKEVSGSAAITLRVVPFTNEQFVETTHPILYAGAAVPQLDTVQVNNVVGGNFLGAEAELQRYRVLLDKAEGVALDAEESRQLIHHIAREL